MNNPESWRKYNVELCQKLANEETLNPTYSITDTYNKKTPQRISARSHNKHWNKKEAQGM